MNRILSFSLVLLLVAVSSCAPSKGGGRVGSEAKVGTGKSERVMEDLSQFRPTYEVTETGAMARIEPTKHNNDQVAVLMDTVASVNKNIKYAQGYRILAYNGSQRQMVMDLRKAIISRVPDVQDYLTYQQPNFRLVVGDFFSRVEAQQVLNQISDLIPNAQIVPDKINLRKN
ncbi:sporulation protein [Pontibacter flavimaris]|uniref:Sporulation protein n=1 Tax=Pontibacter flavimaris TaxID=1797110 RepID=A0A1Q5PA19_9BACT|nr:sporulation protein [Pontibacter flavimaris]OKL39079.1 sporulation protein [Pontibacter flavimaris]